jgi:Ion channel regulatory protein UNC-93
LNGLGGGGQIDTETASNSNVAVYSTFAACAFFAGYVSSVLERNESLQEACKSSSINNKLGSRLTLLIGTAGYALNIGSYLLVSQYVMISITDNTNRALNIHPNAKGFVIGSGAILGICAGFLWTAQGSLMMAYPTEGQKGVFVGVFWAIFNLGGVVGSSVALGQNIDSKERHFVHLHKKGPDISYRPTQVSHIEGIVRKI